MLRLILTSLLVSFFTTLASADVEVKGETMDAADKKLMVKQVKSNIMQIAQNFSGMGDPDGQIQAQLQIQVDRLIALSPQKRVKDRLDLIVGPWKQIFGPYEFSAERSENSTLDPEHVYQIVYEDGYYYNVGQNNYFGAKVISALRGIYELQDDGLLAVQFTDVRFRWGTLEEATDYVSLPALIENKEIRSLRIPDFFTGPIFRITGTLREVYTDQDMRILYGSTSDGTFDDYIYIMKRVDLP